MDAFSCSIRRYVAGLNSPSLLPAFILNIDDLDFTAKRIEEIGALTFVAQEDKNKAYVAAKKLLPDEFELLAHLTTRELLRLQRAVKDIAKEGR